MKKMNEVMTVRLPKDDIEAVELIASNVQKDKSTVVRELVEYGKIYYAVMQYQENKLSIGKAVEISGLCLSDFIDLLAKFRIESKIDLGDYLKGKELAEKIF